MPLPVVIAPMLELGLSARRIYQDLVAGHGFDGSYPSVRRYVAKLKASEPARVWRIECQPGEEMQVDFGLGAPLAEAGGKTRRTWWFRAVLSCSRKGYSEVVLRQDTETSLRVLENAVRYFGGVPRLLNFDNLKAAGSFLQRVLFNASKAYVRQLEKSESYHLLCPVWGLSLLDATYRHQFSVAIN